MASVNGGAVSYLVHGADESYYTGKLEAYLRAKGIAYDVRPFGPASMRHCARHTGVVQIPQVECSDGTWLIDTTLIIEYFERRQPEPRISPSDPATRLISWLLEDYADEWLWRPAMHYRWSYPETARLMSGWLGEHLAELPLPMAAHKLYWRLRQRRQFVLRDGVDDSTRNATEACYLDTLDALEAILRRRSFVMGERPCEADFGFFASMFRHFGCDPTPARIMRKRAPGVYEWVARMWNLSPPRFADRPLPAVIEPDLAPLLATVGQVYLRYLEVNETAYLAERQQASYFALGVEWKEPVKPYRVWCLDRLRAALAALDAEARSRVAAALDPTGFAILAKPRVARVPEVVRELPLTAPVGRPAVDSWWRPRAGALR